DREGIGETLKFVGFLSCLAKVREGVAIAGSLFVILRRGGLLHLRFELGLHFFALAVEEIGRGQDLLQVLLASDIADARSGAEFKVAVETMFVIRLARRQR